MVDTLVLEAHVVRRAGSSPVRGTINARLAKLVNAAVSEAVVERLAGSSPVLRTINRLAFLEC